MFFFYKISFLKLYKNYLDLFLLYPNFLNYMVISRSILFWFCIIKLGTNCAQLKYQSSEACPKFCSSGSDFFFWGGYKYFQMVPDQGNKDNHKGKKYTEVLLEQGQNYPFFLTLFPCPLKVDSRKVKGHMPTLPTCEHHCR